MQAFRSQPRLCKQSSTCYHGRFYYSYNGELKLSQPVNSNLLKMLREHGVISNEEIALQEGDLYVAENVVSGARRIIEVSTVISESRRLLKG